MTLLNLPWSGYGFFSRYNGAVPALHYRREDVDLVTTAVWLGVGPRIHTTEYPQLVSVQGGTVIRSCRSLAIHLQILTFLLKWM